MIRWFRLTHLLDAAAAADRLAWENSWFSIDASVRIAVNGIQLHVYCQHLEHLLRYCARPPFALERLSVIRVTSGSEETAGRRRLTRSERFASGRRPGWLRPREVRF